MATKKRVLILGGGFGGIAAAMRLEKTIAKEPGIEVTLVNRENFVLFTPMLHEVAASDLELTAIVNPIRRLLRRVKFFAGEVGAIDLDAKKVTLVHGGDGHGHEVGYDYLLIALGSVTNLSSPPGVREHVVTMKTLGDAIHLRNRVIANMEEADTECAASARGPLMTFVVVGGGFAGVETAGGLRDFLDESLRFYPNIRREQVRVVIVHAGEAILPELGPELGWYAREKLGDRGVEVLTNCRVAGVDERGITLSEGMFIATRTVVWTAGTMPHPLVSMLPCERERGRLRVNEYLELPGYPGVWALGDCALIPDGRTGQFHPPTAQHALREGKVAAGNIVAAVRGGRKRAFEFSTIGQLAAIGRRRGVAKIFGVKFSGFLAWFLWRTIYLMKLPRFEKKLRVALDWTLDLFFSKDIVQYLTVRGNAVELAGGEVRIPSESSAIPHSDERAYDATIAAGVS